jgi:F-type H+-transporting ATPase subunit b
MAVALLTEAVSEEETNNFLIPNATFLFELLTFGIILLILWKFVVPPISRAMAARQEQIKKQLDESREAKERLDAAEAEYKQALLDTQADAARIRDEARAQGQQIIAELRQKAQEEADRIAAREQSRREAEREQIVSQLRGEVGQIAVELAGRIVGESLDDEARQRRMVERFIADLEAANTGDGHRPAGGDPVVAG